jgi:hypothetical protein
MHLDRFSDIVTQKGSLRTWRSQLKELRLFWILLTILAVTSVSVYGQAVNATLLGTITDPTGSTIPDAKVTVTETNTGLTRNAQTNRAGFYTFPNLDPGKYRVEVEQTGFRKSVRDEVDVLVNSAVRIDMQLQIGSASETVNVTAETPLLQTDRADTGRKIETQQLASLPLGYNRNFQSLLSAALRVLQLARVADHTSQRGEPSR